MEITNDVDRGKKKKKKEIIMKPRKKKLHIWLLKISLHLLQSSIHSGRISAISHVPQYF